MIDSLLGELEPEDWQVYTPVLRAKASERKALAALTPGVRRRIAPIIEFVPEWSGPPASGGKRKSRKPRTPEEYVRRTLTDAVNSTPAGTRSFLYFGHAGADARWQGVDLWTVFEAQVPPVWGVIPLVDLPSSAQASALAHAVHHAGGAVGCRIQASDLGPRSTARLHRLFGHWA